MWGVSRGTVLAPRQEPPTRGLGRLFPAAFARNVVRSWGNGHLIGDGATAAMAAMAAMARTRRSATRHTLGTSGTEAVVAATNAYEPRRMSRPAHDGP